MKETACNAGDPVSIPGLGRSPGEGNGNPLQYSCLGNPMNRGAQWVTVHGVAKSQTRLSNWGAFYPAPSDWSETTLWVLGLMFLSFVFFFKLYKIVLVLPNIKMDLPQVYMCSPSWTLLPPPSPYHPSGSSQCTSPKHPVRPTWLYIPGCLALGEWPHHRDYLGHEDLFYTVLLCILLCIPVVTKVS